MKKAQTQAKNNNVFLFTGEDDFSMHRKVQVWKKEFAKKHSQDTIHFYDTETFEENDLKSKLEEAISPSLFSSKKLLILKNVLPGSESFQNFILELMTKITTDCFVVFWQTKKLDGRLSFTKEIGKIVTINQFPLPHGNSLNAWISQEARNMDLRMDEQAIEQLAQSLGRDLYEEKKAGGRVVDTKEAFNLWQAYHELTKLRSFKESISKQDVISMVKPRISENVFVLADAILKKEKQQALSTFENLLQASSLDEKSTIIKLTGLLAEQLKGILFVSMLKQQGLGQSDMAETLGWSPGRIFVVTKQAALANSQKVMNLLKMLQDIDLSLKSTDSNPKLLFNLFITKASIN